MLIISPYLLDTWKNRFEFQTNNVVLVTIHKMPVSLIKTEARNALPISKIFLYVVFDKVIFNFKMFTRGIFYINLSGKCRPVTPFLRRCHLTQPS